MFKNTPVISLIPARGGSKGIPLKNLALVLGKPMIFHTLKASRLSKIIDKTYISTDNNKIIKYLEQFDVNIIKRPKNISKDKSSASSVVSHFLKKIDIKTLKKNPYIVYLQPTSPLRDEHHIDKAFRKMKKYNSEGLVSIAELSYTPFKTFTITKDNRLKSIFDEKKTNFGRQDLPMAYKSNGAIYIFRAKSFLRNKSFPSNGSLPYLMNNLDSTDIDTMQDLRNLNKVIK